MKKLVAIFGFVIGFGIFVTAVFIATPTSRLGATKDIKVTAEYEAPVASFMGHVEAETTKGKAHTVQSPRVPVREDETAEVSGPEIGKLGNAMGYRLREHNTKVPNPKMKAPKRTPIGDVVIGEIIYEVQ